MNYKRLAGILAISVIILNICSGTGIAFNGSKEIPPNGSSTLVLDLAKGDRMFGDIHSRGHSVDVYIMDQKNFDSYINFQPSNYIYAQEGVVDLNNYSFTVSIPGKYYLVVANRYPDPVVADINLDVAYAKTKSTNQSTKQPKAAVPPKATSGRE